MATMTLCAVDLAGFCERFEMTEVLNDRLFRVAARQGFPCACQFAHAKLLQHCNDGSTLAGRGLNLGEDGWFDVWRIQDFFGDADGESV